MYTAYVIYLACETRVGTSVDKRVKPTTITPRTVLKALESIFTISSQFYKKTPEDDLLPKQTTSQNPKDPSTLIKSHFACTLHKMCTSLLGIGSELVLH